MFMQLNEVPSAEGYTPLPAGDYLMWLSATEVKDTKNGGKRTDATFDVIDGPKKGSKMKEGFNFINPQYPDNQRIAQGMARKLAECVNAPLNNMPLDLGPCKLKPVIVTLKIQPAREQYGPRNAIVTFKPATGVPTPGYAGAAPTAGGSPPWMQAAPAPQPATAPQPQYAPAPQPQYAPQPQAAPQYAPAPQYQPAAAPQQPAYQQPQQPMTMAAPPQQAAPPAPVPQQAPPAPAGFPFQRQG